MLLIKNGRIFTMADTVYEKGSILIKSNKIKKIAEYIDVEDDVEVIDAEGNWVMPGLIESHCHIGIMEEKKGIEGNDCNEIVEPVTPYLQAIDAVNPMDAAFHNAIKAGITSVMVGPGSSNVVGGQFTFIKCDGRKIDDMQVLTPAAMKIAFGENPKRNYSNQNIMPTTRMAIASMLREEIEKAFQYKRLKEKALQNKEYFEEDYELEGWIPVLNKKIPMKAHVHRADDIMTAIRIAKEYNLDITLDHCTEGHFIIDQIKESGYPAIIGPTLASRNKIEVQYMDFKTVGILNKAGILVAVTTDHPVSLIQYLPLCAGLAVKEGLDMEEGLKAITINPAKICRVDDRVGSLEEGKDADIAIFDGNPMEVFTSTLYTIINGKVVYKKE